MELARVVFQSGRWGRHAVFLTCWSVLFAALLIRAEGGSGRIARPQPSTSAAITEFRGNRISGLRVFRWDREHESRPTCSLEVGSLLAENNNVGFLRTALQKILRIEGLELVLHRYSFGAGGAEAGSLVELILDSIGGGRTALSGEVVDGPAREDGLRFRTIDLGHVSELCVEDFAYRLLSDGSLRLGVRSSKATTSYKQPGVLVLRGRVTLEAGNGRTLKGNHILWCTENDQFIVRGVYVIRHDGSIETGKNICVDAQLHEVGAGGAAAVKEKEEHRWLARW